MSQDKQRLSLKEAIEDFGWLPLTLLSIGGAISLIDIAELVADGLTLVTPFEVVLKGYRRVTEAIGALVEPRMQPFIKWLSAAFDWELNLQPIWRSLFVLGMVFVLGAVRAGFRGGLWGQSILTLIVMSPCALGAAAATGLLPSSGDWWAHGLIAATPPTLLLSVAGIMSAIHRLSSPPIRWSEAWRLFIGGIQFAATFGALGFVAAAVLSLILPNGAGLVALGGVIAVLGARVLLQGLSDPDRGASRTGLAMLGGFVAAGMILISNWALLALGVSPAS